MYYGGETNAEFENKFIQLWSLVDKNKNEFVYVHEIENTIGEFVDFFDDYQAQKLNQVKFKQIFFDTEKNMYNIEQVEMLVKKLEVKFI